MMERKAGRYRMQVLLVAEQRQALQALLRRWQPTLKDLPLARKLRFALDVDPVDLA
jgi:primosomal protein N' (replication factor Y)